MATTFKDPYAAWMLLLKLPSRPANTRGEHSTFAPNPALKNTMQIRIGMVTRRNTSTTTNPQASEMSAPS